MIDYTSSGSGFILLQVFGIEGSVLPKALGYGIVNAVVAAALHYIFRAYIDELNIDKDKDGIIDFMDGTPLVWAGYTSILGFLIVFRNNQAYSRFWEGATLVRQVRGEWFNAVSAMLAWTKADSSHRETEDFKHLLVCLASVLFCSALRQICELDEESLQVIDLSGINPESIQFLEDSDDRCQIIISWLQRMIMDANRNGVLDVPPPILSRVFQELSKGVVNLSNLKKIEEIPFPYPYQQMLIFMLLVHNGITSCLAAATIDSMPWAVAATFLVTACFWAVIYIAVEIDQPFGDDPNDLPLIEMQDEFNRNLLALLQPEAHQLPIVIKRKTLVGMSIGRSLSDSGCAAVDRKNRARLSWTTTADADPSGDNNDKGKQDLPLGNERQLSPEDRQVSPMSDETVPKEVRDIPAMVPSFLTWESGYDPPVHCRRDARLRAARFLKEAADLFEEELIFEAKDHFLRNISGSPEVLSPSKGRNSERWSMSRSSSSGHLGSSTALQNNRLDSATDRIGDPSSLAAAFKQAKEATKSQKSIEGTRKSSKESRSGRHRLNDLRAKRNERGPSLPIGDPSDIPVVSPDLVEISPVGVTRR